MNHPKWRDLRRLLRVRRFDSRLLKRVAVVLYDAFGAEALADLLEDETFAVFHKRPPLTVRMDPRIWAHMILNRDMSGSVYFRAGLSLWQPRLVLTFTHNSLVFHTQANNFPGAAFVAIQNGVAHPHFAGKRNHYPQEGRYLSSLCVLNDLDRTFLDECEAAFAAVFTIGSLQLARWRSARRPVVGGDEELHRTRDFLISQGEPTPAMRSQSIVMYKCFECVDIFRNFLIQNPEVEGVVALPGMEEDTRQAAVSEIDFLRTPLGSDVTFEARSTDLSSFDPIPTTD